MKKFLSLALAAIISLSAFTTTASATEMTGDTASTCNVTFDIKDETGSYPGSSITVEMNDITGTVSDNYTLYGANSWNSEESPIYTVVAPTTYNVTISDMEEGYKVVTTEDHSDNLQFAAPSQGNVTVTWSIVTADTEEAEEAEAIEEEAAEEPQETPTAAAVEIDDEEAAEVYQTFLNAVSYIKDDPDWEWFLGYYNRFEGNGVNYVKYFGGTTDDWAAMDPFDQFIVYETYIRFALRLDAGTYSEYFDDVDEFKTTVIKDLLNRMDVVGDVEDVKEAYTTLAVWQYEQIVNHHEVYNFFAADEEEEEVAEVTEPAETETVAEEVTEEPDEDAENVKGMWATVANIVKSHRVEIGIGVVGILILAGVFIIRSRKRDDEEE